MRRPPAHELRLATAACVRQVGDNHRMEMREAAEQYCVLVEQAESFERERFAALLAESLAALLWAASRISPTFTDMNDLPRLSDEQWRERCRAVHGVLGDWHLYATTVEPLGEEAMQVGMVPLSDDLADIWRDLKPGRLRVGRRQVGLISAGNLLRRSDGRR